RLDTERVERGAEDGLVRLRLSVRAGTDRRVDVEAVVDDEVGEVARAVRDETDPEPCPPDLVQDRQRILVQVEVRVLLPRLLDRNRALVRTLARAAHASNDPLGERDPDLLV